MSDAFYVILIIRGYLDHFSAMPTYIIFRITLIYYWFIKDGRDLVLCDEMDLQT